MPTWRAILASAQSPRRSRPPSKKTSVPHPTSGHARDGAPPNTQRTGDWRDGVERMNDKIVLGSGGAGGTGSGIARRMASEGATLLVTDILIEGAERVSGE